jgi:hydrophobic/amphiphilic exporter-1 (mainly G- bacteria), HAE1 family
MSLPRFAVRRPVTTGMLVLATIILGLISLGMINLDLWPSFQRPVLRVSVPYPNASPAEVERRIVRPLEDVLGTVRHLETMRSTAGQDQGSVELEFAPGTDMELAALEVREKVDRIRAELPADVRRVDVRRFASDAMPVLRGAIAWEGDPTELADLLERRIEPALMQVPGVAQVEFSGIERKEITVELDQGRLQAAGISAQQVSRALSRGNVDVSGGEIELTGMRYLVRSPGQIRRVEDIAALPLRPDGLRLGDVAEVRYDYPERDFFYRLNLQNARQFQVYKDSDANTVGVAGEVKAVLEGLRDDPTLAGMEFRFWQDQSKSILEALFALLKAGAFGGGLAIVVLFFFLRRITPTLIVSAAIPVSVIFTFVILYLAGASVNVITLSGLMIAVGMLIDNAVVVVENVFRHREKGDTPEGAAQEGAAEVGLAIVAGTLTTIIVFAPLFFMTPNEMGTNLREFAMSVSFAMVASLIVAFTLVPLLCVRLLRGSIAPPGRYYSAFSGAYRRTLDRLLGHRILTFAVVTAVFVGGVMILQRLPKEMMPQEDNRFIMMSVNVPRSMTFEQRSELFRHAETLLLERREELEIQNVSAFSGPRWNNIFLTLKPFSEGARLSSAEISEQVQGLLPVLPGVEWRQRRAFGGGGRLQVRLIGESTAELARISEQVEWRLAAEVPGVTNLQNSLQAGNQEVRVRVDRDAARRLGVSSQEVAQTVSGALRGQIGTRFRTDDREIDVLIQLREDDRVSIDQLSTLAVSTPEGSLPLSAVARLELVGGPQDIRREDRRTSLQVTGEMAPGANREEVMRGVQAVMATIDLPPGYQWDLGRQFRQEQQQFGEMAFAAKLALVLIYILLAALFESLLLPLVIYFSIFFAIPGLGLVFWATGTSLSILSFLGILVTVGIVVNNSIVMIDLVNQLREKGMARREALLEGCSARLRPVLMTSLTTLLGLIPMAFLAGEGMGQMFAPIGRAVIGGLTSSMILTLLLTPVLYAWADDIGRWLADVWAGARAVALGRGRGAEPAAGAD